MKIGEHMIDLFMDYNKMGHMEPDPDLSVNGFINCLKAGENVVSNKNWENNKWA
jgi:hypothetical protein